MTATTNAIETYREQLDALARDPVGRALWSLRSSAFEEFARLGFPTTRDEEWKYTDVSPIARSVFGQPAPSGDPDVTPDELSFARLTRISRYELVFVDGRFAPGLSRLGAVPHGVEVASLAETAARQPDWAAEHVGRWVQLEANAFAALNTALMRDGAVVRVRRGAVVEEPIHLLFVASADTDGLATHPRVLVLMDEDSQATIIETYAGLGTGAVLTNAVTEFVLGSGAVADHYKVQNEGEQAFHTATMHVHAGRSASFTSHSFALGGQLARNDVVARLDGEGAECTLNGLYVLAGRQHVDNHTVIDHAKPHCASHELYKGVLDGHSTGVFNGKIIVRPDAQKTDAKQTNQNLLLSNDAVVDTKPQLEISADDVRCTHGATIGQLEEEPLFYLRSRGIGLAEARTVLTYAFASDIVQRVKVAALRERLEADLFGGLGAAAVAG